MLDNLLKGVIKQAKRDLEKGDCSLDEYTRALAEIYEKMNSFNGIKSEDFYKEVEKI